MYSKNKVSKKLRMVVILCSIICLCFFLYSVVGNVVNDEDIQSQSACTTTDNPAVGTGTVNKVTDDVADTNLKTSEEEVLNCSYESYKVSPEVSISNAFKVLTSDKQDTNKQDINLQAKDNNSFLCNLPFKLNEDSSDIYWKVDSKNVLHISSTQLDSSYEHFKSTPSDTKPAWFDKYNKIITGVVIENEVSPYSARAWFGTTEVEASGNIQLSKIEKFENLENLNMEHVTDAALMFTGCYKINNLNSLPSKLSNIKNAFAMFALADFSNVAVNNALSQMTQVENITFLLSKSSDFPGENITSLDLSKLPLHTITNASCAFQYNTKLKTITTNTEDENQSLKMAESTSCMFYQCSSLETLIIRNDFVNSDNLLKIGGMFEATKIQQIDISNWNVTNVTDARELFKDCASLKRIQVAKYTNWQDKKQSSIERSTAMFSGCVSLEGSSGTHYTDGKDDLNYAKWDGIYTGSVKEPGYFWYERAKYKVSASADVNESLAKITYKVGSETLKTNYIEVGEDTVIQGSGDTLTLTLDGDIVGYIIATPSADVTFEKWLHDSQTVTDHDINNIIANFNSYYLINNSSSNEKNSAVSSILPPDYQNAKKVVFQVGETVPSGVKGENLSQDLKCEEGSSTPYAEGSIFPYYNSGTNELVIYSKKMIKADYDSMVSLFKDYAQVEEIDMSKVVFGKTTTGASTNLSEMFSGCSALTKIYAADNWPADTSFVGEHSDMFKSCEKLAGGNGTRFISNDDPTLLANVDNYDHFGLFTYGGYDVDDVVTVNYIPGDNATWEEFGNEPYVQQVKKGSCITVQGSTYVYNTQTCDIKNPVHSYNELSFGSSWKISGSDEGHAKKNSLQVYDNNTTLVAIYKTGQILICNTPTSNTRNAYTNPAFLVFEDSGKEWGETYTWDGNIYPIKVRYFIGDDGAFYSTLDDCRGKKSAKTLGSSEKQIVNVFSDLGFRNYYAKCFACEASGYTGWFQSCINLEYADLSNVNITNNIDLGALFMSCSKLKEVHAPFAENGIIQGFRTQIDTRTKKYTKVWCTYDNMFSGCTALTDIYPSDNFGWQNLGLVNASKLGITKQITSKSEKYFSCNNTFQDCSSLKSIHGLFKNEMWQVPTDCSSQSSGFLYKCSALEEIELGRILDGSIFSKCDSLKTIYSAKNYDYPLSLPTNDKVVGGNGTTSNTTKDGYIDSNEGKKGLVTYLGDDKITINYMAKNSQGEFEYIDFKQQVKKGDSFTVQGMETNIDLPSYTDEHGRVFYATGWNDNKGQSKQDKYDTGTSIDTSSIEGDSITLYAASYVRQGPFFIQYTDGSGNIIASEEISAGQTKTIGGEDHSIANAVVDKEWERSSSHLSNPYFSCWENAAGETLHNGDTIEIDDSLTDDIVLNAVWSDEYYEATIDLTGGRVDGDVSPTTWGWEKADDSTYKKKFGKDNYEINAEHNFMLNGVKLVKDGLMFDKFNYQDVKLSATTNIQAVWKTKSITVIFEFPSGGNLPTTDKTGYGFKLSKTGTATWDTSNSAWKQTARSGTPANYFSVGFPTSGGYTRDKIESCTSIKASNAWGSSSTGVYWCYNASLASGRPSTNVSLDTSHTSRVINNIQQLPQNTFYLYPYVSSTTRYMYFAGGSTIEIEFELIQQ